eukprot:m.138949 g.138949  ORF g.138949 m.138949 type:complete len:646 (-) comp16644_c2_seq2:393-2330(-)
MAEPVYAATTPVYPEAGYTAVSSQRHSRQSNSDYSPHDNVYADPGDSGPRQANAVMLDYEGPKWDNTQFYGAFWSTNSPQVDSGFEGLMTYLHQSNDYCRDVLNIMKERALLEETYYKGLQKLSTKASKIGENTFGSLRSAWDRMLGEFDDRATWHYQVCELLRKRVCDPLTIFREQQKKDHLVQQKNVEKAAKAFYDARAVVQKSKRVAFTKCKDAETANVKYVDAKSSTGTKVTEKDIEQLQKAAYKAERMREKSDAAYREDLSKFRLAQEDFEQAMVNACKELQFYEEQKAEFLKKLYLEISVAQNNLLTDMSKTYVQCINICQQINPAQDSRVICMERGTGPYEAVQSLYDNYAESQANPIDPQRRKKILLERLEIYKKMLQTKHRTRVGTMKLFEASRMMVKEGKSNPEILTPVAQQLIAMDYALAAAHATVSKIRAALEENAGKPKHTHSLMRMVVQTNDKGVTNSELRLPGNFLLNPEKVQAETDAAGVHDGDYGVAQIIAKDTMRRMTLSKTRQAGATASATAASAAASLGPPPSHPAPAEPIYSDATNPTPQVTEVRTVAEDVAEPDDDFDFDLSESAVICYCEAMYDYVPSESDELALRVGDRLEVFDNMDETWWEGRLNGQVGIFPREYVRVIE